MTIARIDDVKAGFEAVARDVSRIELTLQHFGAIPGTSDSTAAIQRAIDSKQPIRVDGQFTVTAPLTGDFVQFHGASPETASITWRGAGAHGLVLRPTSYYQRTVLEVIRSDCDITRQGKLRGSKGGRKRDGVDHDIRVIEHIPPNAVAGDAGRIHAVEVDQVHRPAVRPTRPIRDFIRRQEDLAGILDGNVPTRHADMVAPDAVLVDGADGVFNDQAIIIDLQIVAVEIHPFHVVDEGRRLETEDAGSFDRHVNEGANRLIRNIDPNIAGEIGRHFQSARPLAVDQAVLNLAGKGEVQNDAALPAEEMVGVVRSGDVAADHAEAVSEEI